MAGLLYLLLHIAWVSKVLVVSWETGFRDCGELGGY